ncbi:uncharacterized protein LOC121386649 [Gigantopelta aegis]|uniref:uncharacterized protein LOC121386649 n=1 Tax=Gigantopelta aegis TaxID=1735272 RepID=UPI001B88E646|nr:uncharacterized protein LOC121386649 [Gigantopelta aegis]
MDCFRLILLMSMLRYSLQDVTIEAYPSTNVKRGQQVVLTCRVSQASNLNTTIYFKVWLNGKKMSACTIEQLGSHCNVTNSNGYQCKCFNGTDTASTSTKRYQLTVDTCTVVTFDPFDWWCHTATWSKNARIRISGKCPTDRVADKIDNTISRVPVVKVQKMIYPHNKTIKVICEADGNHANYKFYTFTHIRKGKTITELNGTYVLPNKYVLTIHPYSYNDSGTYQCSVSNGVKGSTNVQEQTGIIAINIEPMADMVPRELLILVASGIAGLVILLVIIVTACVINKGTNSKKAVSVIEVKEDTPQKRTGPVMEDNDLYGQGAGGPSVSFASFGHEDISDMYSVVNTDGRTADDDVSTNPADDDITSMYAAVNKGQRFRAEEQNTMDEDELSSTYAVVKKTKKSGDKTKKGKKTKGTHDDGADDIYAQVDKKKMKGKKHKSAEQKDETEPQAVGYLNPQTTFCSVYEAI